jgi:hypothetical protein
MPVKERREAMSPLEVLAHLVEWATKDTAYNLEFIPAGRLAWQPAPTAKSVLEMVNEMSVLAQGMAPVLGGGPFAEPDYSPPTTREGAQALLLAAGREYAQALRAVQPEELGRPVAVEGAGFGFGTFPLAQAAGLPVVEILHHRGQIIYVQSLLGDTDVHVESWT